MDINATLFVQAFNFFIVYLMLRFFLFKPVVSIIEHEQAQENAILTIIDQQKKSIEILSKERWHYWYLCQEYFKTHQPHSLSTTYPDTAEKEVPIVDELPSAAIDNLIMNTQTILEEKIKHVH